MNGVKRGVYKSAGGLVFVRVFGAGHKMPYYRESSFPLLKRKRDEIVGLWMGRC